MARKIAPLTGRKKGAKMDDKPAKQGSGGRPRKEVPFVGAETAGLKIQNVPLGRIDLDDRMFRFRVALRAGPLAESIAKEGQQFPVVLRKREDGKLQVISGFRRITAIQKLGWDRVKAVVRKDLDDDGTAARVSILENEARQTYNDLDRAYAVLAYRNMGRSHAEIEEIFRVGERQRQRLQELTSLPDVLHKAVGEGQVSATNALRLMQFARKYPDTDVKAWVDWMIHHEATLAELNSALKKAGADREVEKPLELFVYTRKAKRKAMRIRPISIGYGLAPEQKQKLLKDLDEVRKFLERL